MRYLVLILIVASVVWTLTPNRAQAQPPNQPIQFDVRQLMSAGEFKATGLDKLSSGELDALNRWLANFTHQVFQTAIYGVLNNAA